MKRFVAALALALAACSPAPSSNAPMPVENGPQPAQAPTEVLAAINAAVPGFTATSAVSDNSTGAQGFRVTGTANGQTHNVQLMHMNEGWQVVSIRRDIAWANARKRCAPPLGQRSQRALLKIANPAPMACSTNSTRRTQRRPRLKCASPTAKPH